MSFDALNRLRPVEGVRLHNGISQYSVVKFEEACGVRLPADHRAMLQESNGVEAYGGYLRIFGIGTDESTDLARWNDQECWKFAWRDRCKTYLCFAETAWGDQYAYDVSSISCDVAQVFFLDCLSMTPTPVSLSFSEFFEREFVRSAKHPNDVKICEARKSLGDLLNNEHVIYVPSPLLGGTEDVAHAQRIDARSAMICNGDVATQLDVGPANKRVTAVTAYVDSAQRVRLQLDWD
jgi:hypothetical protein